MSFIYLDAKSIFLFVILLILMFTVSVGCLVCAAVINRKNEKLEKLLLNERKKAAFLNRCNLGLKIKCSEFEGE